MCVAVSAADGYCTVDQAERAADAPCHMIERETFQVDDHVVFGVISLLQKLSNSSFI